MEYLIVKIMIVTVKNKILNKSFDYSIATFYPFSCGCVCVFTYIQYSLYSKKSKCSFNQR